VRTITLPIRAVRAATPRAQIVRLDLGHRAFEYAPGQAVLVATHGEPLRKPFSICNAPEDARRDRTIELLIGSDAADASEPRFVPRVHDLVDVEGPVGTFTFPQSPAERRFLFVAGGTGIAPLRAMLGHALRIAHAGIGVFYSARTPDEFAYERELRDLAASRRIDLRQTVTRWTGDEWRGTRGRVTRGALADLVHGSATLCFVCGPPGMVDEVPRLLEALGVAPARIRVEKYS
jgi:NAD(P)H-flavin reductase